MSLLFQSHSSSCSRLQHPQIRMSALFPGLPSSLAGCVANQKYVFPRLNGYARLSWTCYFTLSPVSALIEEYHPRNSITVEFFDLHQIYLNTPSYVTSHQQKVGNCPGNLQAAGIFPRCAPLAARLSQRQPANALKPTAQPTCTKSTSADK